MPDITMGCAEVNVMNIDVPRFVVTPPSSLVVVDNPDFAVKIKNPLLKVIVEKPVATNTLILPTVGPPGPPGVSGVGVTDRVIASGTAAAALSGHRVVVIDNGVIRYADPTVAADAFKPMHLTMGALSVGGPHDVLALGTITESTWSWSSGVRLYLGVGGILTQTAPTGVAFIRVVAFTRNATSIYFDPQTPIHVS